MALLHHWTRHASQTIVCAPSADELWQDVFPRIGLEHAFVMSAILSLSALHMAYHDNAQRQYLLNEAARHNSDAVRGLREQLNHMHESMSDALFACASLNVVYIFASAGPLSGQTSSDDSPRPTNRHTLNTDWIPLMRGNWFELDPGTAYAPGDAELQRLSEVWAGDSSGKEIYDETLSSLRRCNAYIHHPRYNSATSPMTPHSPEEQRKWGYNGPWAGPMIWIQFLSEDFLARLYQRQPYALVLFAHFGALMHSLDRVWCFEGWGKRIVLVVGEILGNYWDGWMSWCRAYVER
ncbi:hypothetical protein LTR86_010903 [Recurvomyces mirabilis]|nr:hypothetical protein LTR86_010903 [Recurvomyces mirabilis]